MISPAASARTRPRITRPRTDTDGPHLAQLAALNSLLRRMAGVIAPRSVCSANDSSVT